ncbi:MAG: hypothetical protein VYE73_00785 [Acidobacteriota bacterium]|nr:hypothetical protein [Acidobacteriota bacterium]
MADELDFSGLEEAAKKVASLLKELRDENRKLRRQVKKLTKDLESAGAEVLAVDDPRVAAARERLEALEVTLEGLLS